MRDPRPEHRVTEESHGPEPVLVDAQHPWAELIDVGQREKTGLGQCGADRPPADSERGGGLRDVPAVADSVNDLDPKPGRWAATARDRRSR